MSSLPAPPPPPVDLNTKGYHVLHEMYHRQKAVIDKLKEQLEYELAVFHPIQQAFLRNREKAMPTECYQVVAQYLDRLSRARLAQCDKHKHEQVIYGQTSGGLLWRDGGGARVLEKMYDREYVKLPVMSTMTPLHHASREGTARVVRVLIEAKANLDAVGDGFRTVLDWACEEGHEDVAGHLIDAGADVNANDGGPLWFAADANSLPIVRRLLAAGANPNLPIWSRPLHATAKKNNCEMVNALLEAKADANCSIFGRTALHFAVDGKAVDVIPILIAAGAQINRRSDYGDTPLLWGCCVGAVGAVTALLAANADPNLVDNESRSPLVRASRLGYTNIVIQLLAANANVHLVDSRGHTAVQRAKRGGHQDVVRFLLLAAGAEDLDDDDVLDSDDGGDEDDEDDDDDEDDEDYV